MPDIFTEVVGAWHRTSVGELPPALEPDSVPRAAVERIREQASAHGKLWVANRNADVQLSLIHIFAGGTLPGTPGVILGHNADVAWGATNATVVTEVVYRTTLKNARTRWEVFHVRFGRDARLGYKQTAHGFVAQSNGAAAYSVDWNAATLPRSPVIAFAGLDRARSINEALAALQTYPGPPQNFVIADRSGAAAYHLSLIHIYRVGRGRSGGTSRRGVVESVRIPVPSRRRTRVSTGDGRAVAREFVCEMAGSGGAVAWLGGLIGRFRFPSVTRRLPVRHQ